VDLIPGEVFVVPPEGLVLGRRASAGLRVASSMVAPAHARVEASGEGLVVVDLGSTNGTEVNGAQVERAELKPGDRLTLASAFDFGVVDLDSSR
jgi:pSer/pThr/pTyr-binding forkhead associated (FHA) protein